MSTIVLNDRQIVALSVWAANNSINCVGDYYNCAHVTNTIQTQAQSIARTLHEANVMSYNETYKNNHKPTTPTVTRNHAAIVPDSDNDIAQTLKFLNYNCEQQDNWENSRCYKLINAMKNALFIKAYPENNIPNHNNFAANAKGDGTTGAISLMSLIPE